MIYAIPCYHTPSLSSCMNIISPNVNLTTICQTNLTLTTICVILLKWQTWQAFDKFIISFKKSLFYTHSIGQTKAARIWSFAPTSPLYIIFTDGLSLWTYPFIKRYLNIMKIFHLINSKNTLGKLYATNAPGFWIMHLLVLLKITLMIFFKKI